MALLVGGSMTNTTEPGHMQRLAVVGMMRLDHPGGAAGLADVGADKVAAADGAKKGSMNTGHLPGPLGVRRPPTGDPLALAVRAFPALTLIALTALPQHGVRVLSAPFAAALRLAGLAV
jgi:hypothetical protein